MFEDNVGWNGDRYNPNHENLVYDMDVAYETTDKTFFAWINTCLSANLTYQDNNGGKIQGMPYAWTHRQVRQKGQGFSTNYHMSIDGYGDPDDGAFCYIGFPWGSAALNQAVTGSSAVYAQFVENFFWYALSFDISVNHALDEASFDNFGPYMFDNTPLATYFSAVWPMWNGQEWVSTPWPGCKLVVYGNGNIHLYEYFVHDYLSATGAGIWSIENADNIEGGSNDGQYTRMFAYTYPPIYSQAVIRCSIGWEATGHIYVYGYATTYSYFQVWVSYDDSNWALVNSFTVNQGSPQWIDVGSYANRFRYIAVVVYPEGDIYLDSVLVIPEPRQTETYYVYYTSEFEDGGVVNNHQYLRGSYHDANFAQIYCPDAEDMGQIIGTMNEGEASGKIEIYGKTQSGYDSELYVFRSNDYSNWYQVGSVQWITSTQPYWINVGTYSGNFIALAVVVYCPWYEIPGYGIYYYHPSNLYVDCVRVTPLS